MNTLSFRLCALLCLAVAAHSQAVQLGGQLRVGGQVQIQTAGNSAPLCTITTASEPNGQVNVAYTGSAQTTSNCTGPLSWSATNLPVGTVISQTTGVISGLPTTAATYNTVVTVKDSSNPAQLASKGFTIIIAPGTPPPPVCQINTSTEPGATQNQSYLGNVLQTSNCTAPFNFTVSAGSLPPGTSMNSSNGQVTGTPTAAGTFNFTAHLVDNLGAVANQPLSIVVAAAPPPPSCIITTNSEPTGVVGSSYPANAQTTQNCTAPITFSTPSTVPGLTMNSSGVWSGTPTTAGNYPVIINGRDSSSPPQTPTKTLTISIQSNSTGSGGHNEYCNSSNAWTGPASKTITTGGTVSAPTSCFNTAISNTPSSGPTVNIGAGTACATINNTINTAAQGSTIVIASTSNGAQAVYNCTLQITYLGDATHYLTIETDQVANLPAEGSRISPAWAGLPTLPGRPAYAQPATPGVYVPKFVATGHNFAIEFEGGAGYIRLIGLEATTPVGNSSASQVIHNNGRVSHIILDRMLVHGGNSPNWQSRDDIQAGVTFGGGNFEALIDSYDGDTHCGNVCSQSQALSLGGNSTTADGPFKATNNYLESAGENIFSGGGGSSGSIIQPPADVEIRLNHIRKPLFWKTGDPSYFGTRFELDNLMEFKNMQRAWIEGNIFENAVGAQGTQQGNAIIFGPRSQNSACCQGSANSDGAGTITWVSGGQFQSTLTSSLCGPAPGHCLFVYNSLAYQVATFVDATHVTLQLCGPNGGCANSHGATPGTVLPPVGTGLPFIAFNPGLNPNAVNDDIIFINNAVHGAARVGAIAMSVSDGGDYPKEAKRIFIQNNLFDGIDGFLWNNGAGGACCVWATGWQIAGANGTLFPDSIEIDHNTLVQFLSGGASGFGPNFMWGTPQANNLTSFTVTNNISAGGIKSGKLTTAQAVVVASTQKAGLCFDHNFFVTATTPFGPNGQGTYATADDPPYPAGSDSGGCNFTATGNSTPADFNAMQFTANNNGTNVTAQLKVTSPGHNADSTGAADVGVNWTQLQNATGGVGGPAATTFSTTDSLLNTGNPLTNTYNAPGTSGPNGVIKNATGAQLWLMYPDPFHVTTGSGTITQTYTGAGSMTFAQSLSGLPGAGVDGYPFVLLGCDPFSDCFLGQPPQWPKALNAMQSLFVDINYTFSGTVTGRDVDLLFDQWVCNTSHPTNSNQCLEVEILPYYNFLLDACTVPTKTISFPATVNGTATTIIWDECKGGNVIFVPHTRPGTSSQELRIDLLQFMNEGVSTWGNVAPCNPVACTSVGGIELGSEFGDSATQNYSLSFSKIEVDQTLP